MKNYVVSPSGLRHLLQVGEPAQRSGLPSPPSGCATYYKSGNPPSAVAYHPPI
ncbi:MAG: hypothetical protein AAF915_03360 [Cyanobacteria bacterium P01_D01_bin.50]